MAETLYFKLSPRGFANEVIYFRVSPDQVPEVESEYGDYTDRHPGTVADWTTDQRATMPGVAVDWADRDRI